MYIGDINQLNIDWSELLSQGNWWNTINLESPIKYKPDELRIWNIVDDIILKRLYNSVEIYRPTRITIFFKDAKEWYLSIHRDTSYGRDRYIMYVYPTKGSRSLSWSDLSVNEKRSIRQRIEQTKLYIYTCDNSCYLSESEERNGIQGIELL